MVDVDDGGELAFGMALMLLMVMLIMESDGGSGGVDGVLHGG